MVTALVFILYSLFTAWVWWAEGAGTLSGWLGETFNTAITADRIRTTVGVCWAAGAGWHLLMVVGALI